MAYRKRYTKRRGQAGRKRRSYSTGARKQRVPGNPRKVGYRL